MLYGRLLVAKALDDPSASLWISLGPDHGQLFPNPVMEGLPTIHPERHNASLAILHNLKV